MRSFTIGLAFVVSAGAITAGSLVSLDAAGLIFREPPIAGEHRSLDGTMAGIGILLVVSGAVFLGKLISALVREARR